MNSFLLSLGIAIVLALLAALVGPYFIDWSEYRADIEARIEMMTGLDTTITGNLDIRFLPTGRINISGLELSREDMPFPMVIVPVLSAEFSLAAFLRGQTEIPNVNLSQPIVSLPLGSDGNPAFGFGGESELTLGNIAVGAFSISDGTLAVLGDGNRPLHTINAIELSGEAESLLGPIKMEGRFSDGADLYQFGLGTGRLQESGGVRVRLSLGSSRNSGSLALDAILEIRDGRPIVDGSINLEQNQTNPSSIIPDAGALEDPENDFDDGTQSGNAGTELNFPWKLAGSIRGGFDDLLLQDINLELGEADRSVSLEGTARVAVFPQPGISAILSARRLDLDRILGGSETNAQFGAPLELIDQLNQIASDAVDLDVPVDISISAEGLLLGGGLVENFAAELVLRDREIEINRLAGRMPGGAELSMVGTFEPGPSPSLDSVVRLSIENGSAFADWVGIDRLAFGPVFNPGQRTKIEFEGGVQVTPDRGSLNDVVAQIDGNNVSGQFSFPLGNSPGDIHISANFGSLDLDQYVSREALGREFGGVAEGVAAALLAGRDLTIEVTAEAFSASGISANGVDINIGVSGDILTIRKMAIADLSGAEFAASGRIDDIFDQANGALKARLLLENVANFRPLLEGLFGLSAMSDGQAVALSPAILDLDIKAEGRDDGASVDVELEGNFARTDLRLDGNFTGQIAQLGDGQVTANLFLEDASGWNFLRQFGVSVADLGNSSLGVGNASLNLALEGRPLEGLAMVGNAVVPGSEFDFTGSFFPGLEQSVSGDLTMVSSDIFAWLELAGLGQSAGEEQPATGRAFIVASPEGFQVTALSGRLGATEISADLIFAGAGADTRIDGEITTDRISIPWLFSLITGREPAGAPASEKFWSEVPFGSSRLDKLTGRISIKADTGEIGNGWTVDDLAFALEVTDGRLALKNISARHGEMEIESSAELTRPAIGQVGLSLRMNLSNGDLSDYLIYPEGSSYAQGPFGLQGELSGAGRSWRGIVAGLSGDGVFHGGSGTIARLDPEAFVRILAGSERDENAALDEAAVGAALADYLNQNPLEHEGVDIVFGVADGILKIRNGTVTDDELALRMNMEFDLARLALDSQWVFAPHAVRLPNGEVLDGIPFVTRIVSGPLGRETDNLEVGSLTSWLGVRQMEKNLAELEQAQQEARDRQASEEAAEAQLEAENDVAEGEDAGPDDEDVKLPEIADPPKVEPEPVADTPPVNTEPVPELATKAVPPGNVPLNEIVRDALKNVDVPEPQPSTIRAAPLEPAIELPDRQSGENITPPLALAPVPKPPERRSAIVPPRGVMPAPAVLPPPGTTQTPRFVPPEGEGIMN